MAETLGPVDGPRREYNPPAATRTESGADHQPPVSGKGREPESESGPPYANAEANSSSESFDMLPSTPPETQANSPPMTPARHQSILKARTQDVDPPQYQPEDQLDVPVPQYRERRPSRPMNLGVPSRKPVPGSPGPDSRT